MLACCGCRRDDGLRGPPISQPGSGSYTPGMLDASSQGVSMRFVSTVGALAVASSAGAVPANSPSHVFEGKDIFSLQCVTDPQIRPDGHVVAYVRMSYDIMTDRARRSTTAG